MGWMGVLDCGTTNSRLSFVNGNGDIVGGSIVKVGVKDTALSGSKECLTKGLERLFHEALASAGLGPGDIDVVVSSGMISSELGLLELPHIVAPAGLDELASGMTRAGGETGLALGPALHLVRGVKNRPDPPAGSPLSSVRALDFMRGEETQVMGILSIHGGGLPTTVVNLSSHTKYISVGADDKIRGSVTTLSGQVYESLLKETFIGKSVSPGTSSDDEGTAPAEEELLEATELAADLVEEAGLLRSFLVPRFLDTLMPRDWRIRKRFIEACIAADDLRAASLFPSYGFDYGRRIVLVGPEERCKVFRALLGRSPFRTVEALVIGDPETIGKLAIRGALALSSRSGLFQA